MMTVVEFPNGRRPRTQGRIGRGGALPENVCWLREPYLGPPMTPERLLLAAIFKAMPERQSTKVLESIGRLAGDEPAARPFRVVAIDIALGGFAPPKPVT